MRRGKPMRLSFDEGADGSTNEELEDSARLVGRQALDAVDRFTDQAVTESEDEARVRALQQRLGRLQASYGQELLSAAPGGLATAGIAEWQRRLGEARRELGTAMLDHVRSRRAGIESRTTEKVESYRRILDEQERLINSGVLAVAHVVGLDRQAESLLRQHEMFLALEEAARWDRTRADSDCDRQSLAAGQLLESAGEDLDLRLAIEHGDLRPTPSQQRTARRRLLVEAGSREAVDSSYRDALRGPSATAAALDGVVPPPASGPGRDGVAPAERWRPSGGGGRHSDRGR